MSCKSKNLVDYILKGFYFLRSLVVYQHKPDRHETVIMRMLKEKKNILRNSTTIIIKQSIRHFEN